MAGQGLPVRLCPTIADAGNSMACRSLFFHARIPSTCSTSSAACTARSSPCGKNAQSTTDPLAAPGTIRGYQGNLGGCDGGSGPEDATKFQESIYFRSVDSAALYVNLYMASVLSWPERGFTITQATSYPQDLSGSVTLTVQGVGQLDLKLRVPYWVQKGFTVTVNGTVQNLTAQWAATSRSAGSGPGATPSRSPCHSACPWSEHWTSRRPSASPTAGTAGGAELKHELPAVQLLQELHPRPAP